MKIVICGNYGAKNKGDEMILSGMLTMLREIIPKVEITVLSADPHDTKEKHHVKAVPQFAAGFRSLLSSKKATHKAVEDSDIFILGGGGLFGSLTFRANVIWGIQAWQAYRHNKPVLMLGQSIGRLKGALRKWIVKSVFKKAIYISVRDSESVKRLERLGIHGAHLAPDYAFYNEVEPGHPKEKTVAIALRAKAKLDSKVKILIDWLKSEGWKLSFVNFREPEDDILHREMFPDADFINPEEIANQEVLIGMRLHSIITAIKYQVPFVAIDYAPKVTALLKDTALLSQIFNSNHYKEQISSAAVIREKLVKINSKIKVKNKEEALRLKEFLKDR